MKNAFVGAAGSIVLGIITTATQAAPITSSVIGGALATTDFSLANKVASRSCSGKNGDRHCTRYRAARAYRYRNAESGYYEHDSSALPFGSQRWWDQMLRENRLNSGGGRN